MFKIAISLRFFDIISKSIDLLQTFDRNLKLKFKKYQYCQISHSFDELVLLTSIHSETSILLKYSICILFIIYIGIRLRQLVDNIC